MAKNTILIVEDDPDLNEMLHFLIKRNGYFALQAKNVEEAELRIAEKIPDVILLDWMLPGCSGIEFTKKLKAHPLTTDIGIILLTARAEEEDKIHGLDCGADDYVTKPFSNNELLARIRSALRRATPQRVGTDINHGDLVINPQNRALRIRDHHVDIGQKEFELLYLFVRKPSRVYERGFLLDKVWGKDAYVDERTVDVYIRRLRAILEPHGHGNLISTVRGVGYRLNETD